MNDDESSIPQIQVKFITKEDKYTVPDTALYVPTNITIFGLNELLGELLKSHSSDFENQDIRFDYLINGELLRSKLGEHIRINKIVTEHELAIEYIRATPAPEPLDCLQHDDWVAAVHVSDKWTLSGCYDNSLHIWSSKGKHLLAITGHNGPVKDVSWLDSNSSIATFVSVSQDQSALLWEWDIGKNVAKSVYICRGHERAINCVHCSFSESLFVTGGWDCTMKIWSADTSTSLNDMEEESSSKKRKSEKVPDTRVPKSTLKGHREAVSTVQWIDNNEIMSSSWDHTIKLWDAEYGDTKSEVITNKSVFCADHSSFNRLIVACGADRHVRLYDPRSKDSGIVMKTFTSHKEWVQAVKWSKSNSNLFVSGSYDNDLKLWDMRSGSSPLYDLLGHEGKVLCCDWSKPDVIVSGGSDCTLRLFSVRE